MAKILSEKQNFKWDDPIVRAFEEVKEVIAKAPTFFHQNFKKDFVMYWYASDHTMSSILLQKKKKEKYLFLL